MHSYANLNQNNKKVETKNFAMVPRADIPRSTFKTEHSHKTTFDGGWLVPILVDEVLPGDAIHGSLYVFARPATFLFPVMDHINFETFFFFCPARLLWDNWRKMMGERDNPNDSISYTIPQQTTSFGPDPMGPSTLADYMGIPNGAQLGANEISVNALPFRAYNFIWNEWFRDENLQTQVENNRDDGPDTNIPALLKRNKKHDYFTSTLPWPLKNNAGISVPLLGQAPISGLGVSSALATPDTIVSSGPYNTSASPVTGEIWPATYAAADFTTSFPHLYARANAADSIFPAIYADLSQASGATIAQLRLAVQTQRMLERDARSGTRYTELLQAHFGVMPEDARLQRPEYIGGGRTAVQTQAIPQTSETGETPLGALAGASTISGHHSFSYNATEHGYIIGLANIDAELTYQQGLHRLWTRQTRLDFYLPVFAHLSEQPIRNDEIYYQGAGVAANSATFGYQERWAEYRYRPSRISGLFRSTAPGNIDEWHLAQHFDSLPTLSEAFIQQNPPFERVMAAGATAAGMQFLADMLFNITNTRAMPMYSVPGGMDRF